MTPRKEIKSKLQGESLVRKSLMKDRRRVSTLRLVPDLHVVKIGGHGTIDYGRDVVLPLMEEIGTLFQKYKMLIVTGGGVRVRHILDIGIDLGMPTGVLAELAGKISEQNAEIVALLLSQWGGSRIKSDDLLELPTLLRLGILPVTHGTVRTSPRQRADPSAPHGYRGLSHGRGPWRQKLYLAEKRGWPLYRKSFCQSQGGTHRGGDRGRIDRHGPGGHGLRTQASLFAARCRLRERVAHHQRPSTGESGKSHLRGADRNLGHRLRNLPQTIFHGTLDPYLPLLECGTP